MPKKHEIVSDIDQTLFLWQYRQDMLQPKLNKQLHSLLENKSVLYSTARGKGTRGYAIRPTAEQALQIIAEVKQACQHTNIAMLDLNIDKPYAQCYIDDKAANPNNFVAVQGDYLLLYKVYNSKLFNLILKLVKMFANAYN